MAKLLLLHLSDIHIRTGKEAIIDRISDIARSVQDIDNQLDRTVVVVSGDLAFSGSDAEYAEAWAFIDLLRQELSRRLIFCKDGLDHSIQVIVVPGNHDCNHDEMDLARVNNVRGVLESEQHIYDESVVRSCTSVQNHYFGSLESINYVCGKPFNIMGRMFTVGSVTVADKSVEFLCFNSSWLSNKKEIQGKLLVPKDLVPTARPPTDLVVTVFHHPYGWHEANAGRAFRERVESISDMILTGHEHVSTMSQHKNSFGDSNLYVEGGVLFDSGNPSHSEFNVILLDLDLRKQKKYRLGWNSAAYVPIGLQDDAGFFFNVDWEDIQTARLKEHAGFQLLAVNQQRLDELVVPIRHPVRGELRLRDVFRFPDLQQVFYKDPSSSVVVGSESVRQLVLDSPRLAFSGEGNAGKSSLAKSCYRLLYESGYVPIYIEGATAAHPDQFLKHLSAVFRSQYASSSEEKFFNNMDRGNRAAIIDNFHKLSLNPKDRELFLTSVCDFFGRVLLFSDELEQGLQDLLLKLDTTTNAVSFARYRILPTSHVMENYFIEDWLLMDNDEYIDSPTFEYRRDEITRTIKSLVQGNRLPRYPLFMQIILQSGQTITSMDSQISSYGAYYEIIIRAELARNHTPSRFDETLNLLAEIAYFLFDSNKRSISNDELKLVHRSFEEKIGIDVDFKEIKTNMYERNILESTGELTRFKHKYVFYYFVAYAIKSRMSEERVRQQISLLAQMADETEYANILMFLAHLTRESIVIDAVLDRAQQLLTEFEPETFDGTTKVVESTTLERLSYASNEGDARSRHENYLRRLDEIETTIDQFVEPQPRPLIVGEPAPNEDDLSCSFKSIEIMGQILRGFPASITADRKVEIVNASISLGLKVISFFNQVISAASEYHRDTLIEHIQNSDRSLTKLQAEVRMNDLLFDFRFALAVGQFRFISSAIGSNDLDRIYSKMAREQYPVSAKLVLAAIKLDFAFDFPEQFIVATAKELERLGLPFVILRGLVAVHFFLHSTPPVVKKRVAEKIGLRFSPNDPKLQLS